MLDVTGIKFLDHPPARYKITTRGAVTMFGHFASVKQSEDGIFAVYRRDRQRVETHVADYHEPADAFLRARKIADGIEMHGPGYEEIDSR